MKASDFQVATRWTKEAEIDLSVQGASFIVSGLPTNVAIWEFVVYGLQNDSASNFPKLEAQVSNDGGSTFITSTVYETNRVDAGSSTTGADRWNIVPATPFDGDDTSTVFVFRLVGIPVSDQFYLVGWTVTYREREDIRHELNTHPSSPIDAVKFMLETDNFQHGTMEVWSA